MRLFMSLLLFLIVSGRLNAQHGNYVPLETALTNKDLKKAHDLLRGKFWLQTRECLGDTCKNFQPTEFPDYYYTTGWCGRNQGNSNFLEFYFNGASYLKYDGSGEFLYMTPSCQPIITIKSVKSIHPVAYLIAYFSEVCGDLEMEMIFKDEDAFILKGPACYIDKEKWCAEFTLAEPTAEQKEIMRLKADR